MDELVKILLEEWRVIKSAPITFCSAILLAGFGIWWVIDLRYEDRIAGKNTTIEIQKSTIESQQTVLNQLQSRTETGTPEKALQELETIQEEVKRLRGETNASLQTLTSPSWQKFGNERLVLGGAIHITSKFQRSGLLINIKDVDIKQIEVTELLGEVVGREIKSRKPDHRSYYINKPAGL